MRAFIGWFGVLVLVSGAAPLAAQTGPVRVVVNAANPAQAVSRDVAVQLFMKQRTRWSDNTPVVVVDQGEQSQVRRQFSAVVLRRDVGAVKGYWQQMMFSGRAQPPKEVSGDAEVLALVRGNPGAVGYVSAEAQLVTGVKELPLSR